MADIDDVLARLSTDPGFREHVRADPRAALAQYHLSNDDLASIQGNFEPAEAGPTVRSLFEDPAPSSRLAGLIGLLVPALAVTGLLVGTAAGAAGLVGGSSEPAATAPARTVASVDAIVCPGGDTIATLHSGDRVLAVGRDRASTWIQIRDPGAPDARIWVPAAAADVNGDLTALPVTACPSPSPDGNAVDTVDTTLVAAPTTVVDPATVVSEPTGSTAPTAPTTTTATSPTIPPGLPTTVSPGATIPPTTPTTPVTPVTTATTVTATTSPADTTPPSLAGAGAQPTDVWETAPGASAPCSDPAKNQTIVSATATDPSGVTMSMTFRIGSGTASGPLAMTPDGSNAFQGTLGPFPAPTVPDGTVATVTVTVQATDGRANAATATTTFQLHSASECFG